MGDNGFCQLLESFMKKYEDNHAVEVAEGERMLAQIQHLVCNVESMKTESAASGGESHSAR